MGIKLNNPIRSTLQFALFFTFARDYFIIVLLLVLVFKSFSRLLARTVLQPRSLLRTEFFLIQGVRQFILAVLLRLRDGGIVLLSDLPDR